MRKWIYIICPVVMLAVFLVFYMASKKKWDEAAQAAAASEARAKAEDDAKKKTIEEAAKVAARQRADVQKREEEQKEQARVERWNAETRAIEAVTAAATKDADAASKEAAALEIESDTLRKLKEKENREDFDLLKQVELAHARETTAQLDIQRLLEMLGDRASMAANPAPATVAVHQ